jgi:hypothetical protein
MKSKIRVNSIETRCSPNARTFLRLHTGQPLFPRLVYELQKIVGVLSQFDIERAVVAVRAEKTKKQR